MSTAVVENLADSPGLVLSKKSKNGKARAQSMTLLVQEDPEVMVNFRSRGVVLVIAEADAGLEAAQSLQKSGLKPVILVPTQVKEPSVTEASRNIDLVTASLVQVDGHLGAFAVTITHPEGEVELAQWLRLGRADFDLVLDLGAQPVIQRAVLPLGYYAPADDEERQHALTQLPELVGEFDKPKFFSYHADICAHSASNLTGCTRCLDACPTQAISSIVEAIDVDPYLCQGVGVCATACPTGAIRYAYPPVNDLLDKLRRALHRYTDSGGKTPAVLFYDSERCNEILTEIAAKLPDHVIPVELVEIGAAGLDIYLSALAYGAHQVLLLVPGSEQAAVRDELIHQTGIANTLLGGMGYSEDRLRLVTADAGAAVLQELPAPDDEPLAPVTGFAAFEEKRTTIRLAMEHFYEHAPNPKRTVKLPQGAPFGEIKVDRAGCTLCMACASVCPAAAVTDGDEVPKLLFTEANCVQCGLCAQACPEDVITLHPRFSYDPDMRLQPRVLNEEAPFHCVRCGKPFATQSVMTRMHEKLKGHWMYQDPKQMARLQMCEDCRIEDMMREQGDLISPDKPTGSQV